MDLTQGILLLMSPRSEFLYELRMLDVLKIVRIEAWSLQACDLPTYLGTA